MQQVIPLPEATDYQVHVREKKRRERQTRNSNIDFTRYDITLSGKVYPAQWKRNAILLVVKHLCGKGVSPDEIAEVLFPVRGKRAWRSIDAETADAEEFKALAAADARSKGRRYDDRRWHTKDGDLVANQGRTYAFSNQWGSRWPEAMELLKGRFPEIGLAWEPREAGPD